MESEDDGTEGPCATIVVVVITRDRGGGGGVFKVRALRPPPQKNQSDRFQC